MRALCLTCGQHHEVVRVLEDGHDESKKDIYQVAPLGACEQSWLSDAQILEARARFGQDAIVSELDDDLE